MANNQIHQAAQTPANAGTMPHRVCAGCTLCCRLPEIAELEKPANIACQNCAIGHGCTAYASRPQTCRQFECEWKTDPTLPDLWNPLTSHMMLYRQGVQGTILVDPDQPQLWESPLYRALIEALAQRFENEGGYLILFSGERITRIRPANGADSNADD